MAVSLWGTFWNQMRPPYGPMIMGPFCTGPCCAPMNRSPPAAADAEARLVTVKAAGARSGRETNRVMSLRTRGRGRTPASGMAPAGLAIVKL